jgi:glycosyltransferase involved in cell wall biosynthesis
MPREEQSPRVTVCIPTYNQSGYVVDSITSASRQSAPVKVFVSNDGSTDATASVLEKASFDENVTVVNREHNVGIGRHVNWILRQPTTEFIARVDSDDLLFPRYVEELVGLLDQWPQAGYAHCAVQEIDEKGRHRRTRSLARSKQFEDSDSSLRAMVKGYKVAANIILFRREALSSVDFGSADLNFAEDYDLCVRIAAAGWGNVYTNHILAAYRVWRAPARQSLERKMNEVNGLCVVFSENLLNAYRKRNWDISSLNRRRFELALGHSRYLDEVSLDKQQWLSLSTALMKLAGGGVFSIFLKETATSRYLRQSFTSLQDIKRWTVEAVKRFKRKMT